MSLRRTNLIEFYLNLTKLLHKKVRTRPDGPYINYLPWRLFWWRLGSNLCVLRANLQVSTKILKGIHWGRLTFRSGRMRVKAAHRCFGWRRKTQSPDGDEDKERSAHSSAGLSEARIHSAMVMGRVNQPELCLLSLFMLIPSFFFFFVFTFSIRSSPYRQYINYLLVYRALHSHLPFSLLSFSWCYFQSHVLHTSMAWVYSPLYHLRR